MTDIDDALRDVRSRIDLLDRQIVQLLAARELLVREAGRLKPDSAGVRAPDRVEHVIQRVRGLATDLGASPEIADRTYRAMIAAFVELELAAHRADRHPPTARRSGEVRLR